MFHATDSGQLRHVFAQHVKVFEQHRALVIKRWKKNVAAGNGVFNLAKDPRIGHRAAANQDSIAAGLAKSSERLFDRSHIAAPRDRHAHVFLDRAHQIPIREAAIALLFRAAMQGDVLDATGFREFCGLDGIDRAVRVAGANLDRQRNRNRFLDLFQNRFQSRQIAQQSRATAVLHDFRRRAAAVYIQNIRSDFLGHLGGHAHALRLRAEDLHRKRALVLIETHLAFRFWIITRQAFDRDEFGNSQANAAPPLQQPPERNVSHARHRRKDQRRVDFDVANPEWLD